VGGTPNPAFHGGSQDIMLEFGIRQSIKVASIIGAKLVGGVPAPPTCDLSDGAHASERSCFVPLSSPLCVTFCRVLLARQGFDRQSSPRDVVSLRASWRCRIRSRRKQTQKDRLRQTTCPPECVEAFRPDRKDKTPPFGPPRSTCFRKPPNDHI
jgi:hypothetical protein